MIVGRARRRAQQSHTHDLVPERRPAARRLQLVTSLLSRLTLLLRTTPLSRSETLNRLQLHLLGLVYRKNVVEAGGMTLRIHSPPDVIAKKLILTRAYEPDVAAVLLSLVREGDVVMDIGANIGCHTVALSRRVGASGCVIAVEPDPENVRLLRENVRLNRCSNVTVIPCALADAVGTASLSICAHNRGFQGLVDVAGSRTFVEVPVRTAADVLEGAEPALVKIDVEGAEPLVLAGFDRMPDRIVFEFSVPQLRAFGMDPLGFLESLVAAGYRVERIAQGGRVPTTAPAMAALAEDTGLDYNLVAIRDND